MIKQKQYVPAAATDIEKTLRERCGYIPAREMPEIVAKWEMFKQHGRDITKDEQA